MSKEAKIITGIGVITLIVLFGSMFLLSSSSNQVDNSKLSDETILKKNNNHKIATDSAKVTIVEFADFQCPACGQAYPQIKQVLNDFAGKINYVYRHFPLPQHQNAILAAKSAEAAGEQGRFWEMSEFLFTRQPEWSEKTNAKEVFINYAKSLDLNTDQFSQDIDSDKFLSTINKDKEDGTSVEVTSTPTIFINNKKFTKVASYANLSEVIKLELEK